MLNPKQRIGQIGEDLATQYLVENNFQIVERNHRQKWGEIDIIARQKNNWHFIEVKTMRFYSQFKNGALSPENQITWHKLRKLNLCALAYANLYNIENWQIDLLAIEIDEKEKIKKIRYWTGIDNG